MPDTIRVGVLTDTDGAHLDSYFTSLAKTPEVEKVAVSDPSGSSRALAAKLLGEKFAGFHDSHAKMLAAFEPKLALVSVEPRLTPPVITTALNAGCHVLTEKPACVRAKDFEALAELAEMKHLHLMLALANRVHAPVQEARKLIAAGKLGRLFGVNLFLVADQSRLTREGYRTSWRGSKARGGGGHLAWLGIHWLDLIFYITGLKLEAATGFTDVVGKQPIDAEDSAACSLRFNDRVLGTMLSAFYLDEKFKTKVSAYQSHMQIWGEQGWLKLALFEQEPMTWYSSQEPGEPKVQTFEYPKGQRTYLSFVQAAVRAAAGLQKPPITGAEGLNVLKAIFAVYKAAETGQTQRIT